MLLIDGEEYQKVYNEKGELVSHTRKIDGSPTHSEILDSYAKGCGWPSADEMRKYYPIDLYQFKS
jgi:hypothetical protein